MHRKRKSALNSCLPCLRQVNRQAGLVLLHQGKRTKKILAKDKLKRVTTYSGQAKILSKIQFKLNSTGRYKIVLEAVSKDGLVPNGLVGKELDFSVE